MNDDQAAAHGQCDWCGQPIRLGNAQVTVNRHIEQTDFDAAKSASSVTVIESISLLTLCARCGNRLDSEFLRDLLRAALPRR